jgi:hypothetical protein
LGKVLDKILGNTPEQKKRREVIKLAKTQAKRRAENARLAEYQKGLIEGAKKRGREEGLRKGKGGGGFLGALASGAKAIEKSGIGQDIDLGGIGSGLGSGSAFGLDFGGSSSKKKTKKKKKRKTVTINGKKYRPI